MTTASGLAFENYRRRKRWSALTAAEKKLLAALEDELAAAEEEEGEDSLELVDVVDSASAEKVHLFVLWPFGSGVLVDLKKREVIADVVQHHFDARGDDDLRTALAAAWERQRGPLGVREMVSFEKGKNEGTKPAAPSPAKPPVEAAQPADGKAFGPLDGAVSLDGEEQPAWRLVCDATHERRSNEEVVSALARLSAESKTALLRALVPPPYSNQHLMGAFAKPPKGAQMGSPAARGAYAQRYTAFVIDLAQELDDGGVGVAKDVLAARADWLDKWLPQLTTRPAMSVPHWLEQCLALGILARAAKSAGSALDPSHDALLGALARYHDATYPLANVLAELPNDRATKIACGELALIEHFPSVEGATAAVERFEASGGGPYMSALFLRVVEAIGPNAVPALEAAIARGSTQKTAIAKALKLVGGGKSAPKKAAAKKTAKK